jgi:hypothetical protein
MISIILILGCAAMALVSVLAIALGKAASRADDELDELLAQRRGIGATREEHESYAGLALAQSAISAEPSTTVPLSRTRVGTQRFPVSSFTSRRPRVWLKMPGSGASP